MLFIQSLSRGHSASPPLTGIALLAQLRGHHRNNRSTTRCRKCRLERGGTRSRRGCSLTIEFEGRETQAAESWRLGCWQQHPSIKNSGDFCVSLTITEFAMVAGQPVSKAFLCEGTRNAVNPWINLQAKTSIIFQYESLILAQNERWRQA